MSDMDFTALNNSALSHCPGLLERLLPGGKVNGQEYECSDLSGGKGHSLKVNLASGKWADFAADASGVDLIALVAAIENVNQHEAARQLADMIHYSLPDGKSPGRGRKQASRQDEKPAVIMPVPEAMACSLPAMSHYRHGRPTEYYTYKNESGQLLGHVCRFTMAELNSKGKHKKEFCPLVYTGTGWRWQGFPQPYPFYGLENLPKFGPAVPVLIVEGEHKADVVKSITGQNMAVLSIYGGSGKAALMDCSPLAGKNILYWPDNDEAGVKAAMSFAEKARRIAASIHIVKPPADARETWDLANAIEEEGWNYSRLRDWISANRLDPEEFGKLANERWGTGVQAQDKKEPVYRAIDIFDFMELELPERENLIAPILQTQGIAMLHAQRGIGKTYTALSIAYMVASGGSLFGRWTAPRTAKTLEVIS